MFDMALKPMVTYFVNGLSGINPTMTICQVIVPMIFQCSNLLTFILMQIFWETY